MFTTAELDNYINEAANSYLKQNVPLNDTITKLASSNGLNRDQVARVVEGANTEVYIQLMNQSDDKYVQFENASAEKVAEVLFGTEKVAEIATDDYANAPEDELVVDANFEKHFIIKTAGKINNNNAVVQLSDENWSVSPNPTTGLTKMTIQAKESKTVQLQLTNSEGKLIYHQKWVAPKGISVVDMNLNQRRSLAKGVYYLQAIGLDCKKTESIMIK